MNSNSCFSKNSFRILAFSLATILIAGCGQSNQALIDSAPMISETYKDDLGHDISLPRVPSKIISMAPNITEMVFAIGKGDQLIARSHVCDFPDDAFYLPEITTFPSLDLPTIVSYGPDLVLASTEIHTEQIVSAFDGLNVPLYFQSFGSMEDIYTSIRSLGEMLHATESANNLADSLARLEKVIADSTEGEIRYRTAILMGINPITVVGSKSYLHDMLQKSGGKNVFAGLEEKYPTVSVEELIKVQPEFIILPSRNDQIYQELLAEYPELHTKLPAALNNHVFMVDPAIVVRPGPRVIEGMINLTRILHPKIDLIDLMD